jgi:hypothetical protein
MLTWYHHLYPPPPPADGPAAPRIFTQKIARTKPLLANENTASWHEYVKSGTKKKRKRRARDEANGLNGTG